MSEFDWSQAGTNIHSEMDELDKDSHCQYLNDGRHNIFDRHTLGSVVPHDIHNLLNDLNGDSHVQYINAVRHNRERHPPKIIPEFSMVVSGGPEPEPVFSMDGDIIIVEVM